MPHCVFLSITLWQMERVVWGLGRFPALPVCQSNLVQKLETPIWHGRCLYNAKPPSLFRMNHNWNRKVFQNFVSGVLDCVIRFLFLLIFLGPWKPGALFQCIPCTLLTTGLNREGAKDLANNAMMRAKSDGIKCHQVRGRQQEEGVDKFKSCVSATMRKCSQDSDNKKRNNKNRSSKDKLHLHMLSERKQKRKITNGNSNTQATETSQCCALNVLVVAVAVRDAQRSA